MLHTPEPSSSVRHVLALLAAIFCLVALSSAWADAGGDTSKKALHPGGRAEAGVPSPSSLTCPGTSDARFAELETLSDEEIETEATRLHDFDAIPALNQRLSGALPATWMREPLEKVGAALLTEENCPAAILERVVREARHAGIDSAPLRNFQFYGLVCQGLEHDGRALLVETLELLPEDQTLRENLEWVEKRLAENQDKGK